MPITGITPNIWPTNKNGQIASRNIPSKGSLPLSAVEIHNFS